VSRDDPLYRTVVHELPNVLRSARFYSDDYKVQGSAGQTNFLWAETAWLAVFDRLVTSSAQRGHYLVYLVHPEGKGVYLSLNQAVTEARSRGGGALMERLEDEAGRLRGFIDQAVLSGLLTQPLDLSAEGDRTRGYAVANVAARFYPAGEIPHDTALLADLTRFLRLYRQTTAGIDGAIAAADQSMPQDAQPQSGEESRRYRWHLRAEGRNGRLAKLAKNAQGYRCQACGRDYVEELGPIGKGCVDAHHLTPFSELDERPVALDPAADFAIVCANCHRLIHSETPPLLPDQVARLLRGDTES
jgi:5-methylcytosine-specific restriction protein A